MKEIHKEISKVFLKLGTVAFGGPAAHIAMMEDELISKRQWMSKEEFLGLLGFANLIPGPNSTELAILIGYKMGGKLGLFLAGGSFILPAMLMVMTIGFFYRDYGHLPAIQSVFRYLNPVVVAVIAQALWKLSKGTIKSLETILILLLGMGLLLIGVSEIPTLIICGTAHWLFQKLKESRHLHLAVEPMSLSLLFLTFLKIGSVLYGSGYVLVAFLQSEFVEQYQVLTETQLLDAVAVGEFTPGPVFTTATFIGTFLHGLPGGLLATLGIFLPAFLLILFLNPVFERMRASRHFSVILQGVSIGSLALMAVVIVRLAVASLVSIPAALIFAVTFIGLVKFQLRSYYFILAAIIWGMLPFLF